MNVSITPLDTIYARICQEHGFDAQTLEEAVALYEAVEMADDVPQKKKAALLLAIGWSYRKTCRFDEAEHLLLQALRYFRETAFEQSRDTARAFWFMAENHYVNGHFELARTLFWKAVQDFSASVGLFDEEAKACLVEFAELAEGFARDEDLTGEVDDVIAFTSFCEEMGTDGHITVLPS